MFRITKKLQTKEQECDKLKFNLKRTGILGLMKRNVQLKKALDEIEKTIDNGTADTQTNNAKWLHEYYLTRYCEIREIINKAKDGE